ncbi:MAG TPA: HAD family acid phosphatase [Nocardioides sp.]|uniref:HAD family acid phosphatase n=1 Tax=Nocardioides sp. TaxID=35761 RepID=UPI002E379763|nr:HAD family acid phosphatase [Nocardioides sp.]HEX5088291.1 HAD family acid phosphatase [Nocardioides sp.]
MTWLVGLVTALMLTLAPITAPAEASPPPAAEHAKAVTTKKKVPTRAQWLADVKTAMKGSRAYVRQRVAAKGTDEKLAVNFDIDNTVIATYYDGGGAIPQMARFAKLLRRLGVDLVFNSGRLANQQRRTFQQLTRTGFPAAELCLRTKGETLPAGKQRCRDSFIDDGYTLIANIGNNDTDFVGDGYEKAFRLPNYGVLG